MDRDYPLINDPDNKVGYFYMENIATKITNFINSIYPNEKVVVSVKRIHDDTGIQISVNNFKGTEIKNWLDYFCFSLSHMPGNCGILVSHGSCVGTKCRGKGIAQFLQEIKVDIAKQNGYSQLYCTTVSTNDVENHILEKFGWKKVNTFLNNRTGNTCFEWVKKVE